MKIIKIKYHRIIFMALIAVLTNMYACRKAEVIPEISKATKMKFAVNWDKIDPDAPKPNGAVLWLYHSETPNVPIKIELENDKILEQELKTGKYNIITYNQNIDKLDVLGAKSFNDHRGIMHITGPDEIYSKATKSYQTIHKADYVHTLIGSDPRVINVEPNKPLLVTLKPKTVNHNISISFTVNGTDELKGGTAVITEVASMINFANAKTNAEFPAKIVIPITEMADSPTTKSMVFKATGSTLGPYKNEIGQNKSELEVKIEYLNPEKKPITFIEDISEHFNNMDVNIHNPHIVIDVELDKDLIPKITVELIPFVDEEYEDEIIIKPIEN